MMDAKVLTSAILIRSILFVIAWFQDTTSQLRFTDIDYDVYTDAAAYVLDGGSPYQRSTYRYTPFLAYLLLPNLTFHPLFGKIIFCLGDILAGYLMQILLPPKCKHYASVLWLLNPVVAIISVRGSAESLVACMLLGVIYFIRQKKYVIAGILYGLSVHWRVYPIIFIVTLIRQPKRLLVAGGLTCIALGIFAYHLYGNEFLEEAYWYHAKRIDPRHNFSPYFYPAYLDCGSYVGFVFTVVQGVLQLGLGWSLADDVASAMAIQTMAFVSFNKVVTAQYFVWYLFLLPLILPKLSKSRMLFASGIGWATATGGWLGAAWLLEFGGYAVHLIVWMASLIFLTANVWLICEVILNLSS